MKFNLLSDSDENEDGTDDVEVVERARRRKADCWGAQSEMREKSKTQMKFRHGEQWPTDISQKRTTERRPQLTVNRVPSFIHSITNDQRQNRPAIHVNPVDEGADPAIAKVYQGLIRHIEYDSSADMAYDTAHDHAVTMGFGFLKIGTEYDGDLSFDQKIKIHTVHDPFSVFLDHLHTQPDGSDATWCVQLMGAMSKLEFKRQFPGADPSSFEPSDNTEDGNTIQIAEYHEQTSVPTKIHRLQDGRVITHAQLTPELTPLIHATRDSTTRAVRGYQLSGTEILGHSDWASMFLPIIPVYGTVAHIDGDRSCYGLVKDLMDPARMYNYWITTATELVALAPRPSYVVAEGQITGHELDWENANNDNRAYRTYKPITFAGQAVAPPQREQFGGIPTGIIQMLQLSSDDMKTTTGIYDASLGNRSNETSGVAITARQRESEVANFHYQDNMRRSLRHVGRILIELIPKIIDTPRIARILGEDDEQEAIQLYQQTTEGMANDLSVGKYDATVSTGPSFTTKRQEFVEAAMQLATAIPELWKVAGHLIIKAMQWPKAEEIAELWKVAFTPQGAEAEGLPPELQQQMQLKEQQFAELQQQLQQVTAELGDKKAVEELRARVQVEIAQIQAASRLDVVELQAASALIQQGIEPPPRWVEPNPYETDLDDPSQPTPGEAPTEPTQAPMQPSGDTEPMP